MEAIYYARVSTGSQSVDRQIADIKAECIKRDLHILTGFSETESGRLKVRPGLAEMERYIMMNEKIVNYVIVWELSRLGRTSKVLETIENLNAKGIGLISLKENIDTLNADKTINYSTSLLISLLTAINSYELETIQARSVSGIRDSIRAGRAVGSLNFPYGYRKEGFKKQNKLVIDKEEAKIIEKMFNLYLQGNGTQKIAEILNTEGTLTRTQKILNEYPEKLDKYSFRKRWVDGTIYSILTNPIYIGKRRIKIDSVRVEGRKTKKDIYDTIHIENLRILDDEVFYKVQKLLKSNYNKADKHTKHDYLLEPRKIVCGVCGRNFFAHKRTSKKDNTYKCISRRDKKLACNNAGINIDKIENFIQQIVLFLFEDKLEEKLDNKAMRKKIEELAKVEIERRKKLQQAQRAKLDLVKIKLKGEINENEYSMLLVEYDNDIRKLETDLDNTISQKYKLNEDYLNLKDIKALKMKFYQGTKVPKDLLNKIITKIILTKTNEYPRNVFKERTTITTKNRATKEYVTKELKKDIVMEMTIISFDKEYKFLLSQLTDKLMYYYKPNEEPLLMNMFFVDPKEPLKYAKDRINRARRFFDFVTGNNTTDN